MNKCQSCQEEKEEYVSGLCKECSIKMDYYLEREIIGGLNNDE